MWMPASAVPGARWRTSSRSGGSGNQCVMLAGIPSGGAICDSKNPTGSALVLAAPQWSAFLATVRAGALDPGQGNCADVSAHVPSSK
jgi:Domain of unknown function (DUF397)